MKRSAMFLVAFAVAAASVPSPAAATIVFTVGNNPQQNQEAVVFPDQLPDQFITGSSVVPGHSLTLTGTTSGGILFIASGGTVQPAVGGASIISLVIAGPPLDALIFNTFIAVGGPGGGGTATYSVTDNQNNVFIFSQTLGGGNNFVTISTLGGETFQTVAISVAAGFTDLRNVAAVFQPGAPLPEPGTWALMLLGFGAIGIALRRRRRALAVA